MPIINPFARRRAAPTFDALPAPWPAGAVSLYDQITAAMVTQQVDRELELDAHQSGDPDALQWAAGIKDALFGAPDRSTRQISARTLLAALGKLVRKPSAEAFAHLHGLMADADVLGVIDGFLPKVIETKLDPAAVVMIARRIARRSPDLSAVKLAIGLLGVTSGAVDRDLLLHLGRYEELTLFSVVAMSHMLPDAAASEQAIWALARSTHGWGRIQAVRRLRDIQDSELRRWLLEEGHSNSIMVEEIAHTCAVEGRLLDALRAPTPGEALLNGAGMLIEALIEGGPAEDMDDYSDGAEATRLYVEHVAALPSTDLRRFLHVRAIQGFEAGIEGDKAGWTAARRWAIRTHAAAFLTRPQSRELAEMGLLSETRQDFWPAAEVAKALGLDVWPHYLRRQRDLRSDEWYFLMQTDDLDRVEQILALANKQLDLDLVGSGPGTSMGLGPRYADDSAVDFILQDLKRFPGMGWPLIEVGLRARTIRARNMAHRALEAWDRTQWPEQAIFILKTALTKEPDPKVAQRIQALIDGRALDWD
jgi:hypothetical protein